MTHPHTEWQARRDAQIEAAIAVNRDHFDDDTNECEVPISRHARWLGHADDVVCGTLLFAAIVAVSLTLLIATRL